MSASLEHQTDNIYLLHVTGMLRKSELDAVQADFIENLAEAGAIKLLVLLENFSGWERNAAWDENGFFFRHGDDLEKIAIVGDPRWETEMLAFAGAGVRKGPVRFHPSSAESRARAWLAE
ncbi:MAG: STAS/SEC14 domain-containing protein [Verrucomicrobiota bacterium]